MARIEFLLFDDKDLCIGASLRVAIVLPSSKVRLSEARSRRRPSSINIFRRTNDHTRAKRPWSSTGLVKKLSAPASNPRTRSVRSENAVTIITGIWVVSRLFFVRSQTSNPSISGIIRSSRTISGGSVSITASASVPLWAVSTCIYS